MVFVEKDSFRNLRRLPTDAFRSIPRLPREALPVAASDLVAWYPFRSGTGEDITAGDSDFGDTTDYSASVNGATYKPSGGVTDIETGANSGAFDFDGTDDTLDLGTVADSDQSLTLMTWVRPDQSSRSTSPRFITKLDGEVSSDGAIVLDADGSLTPRTFVRKNGSSLLIFASNQLTQGTFAHVAARYDFTAGALTLFVNGQPVNNRSVGQLPALSSQPWRVGNDNPVGSSVFFDGTVDGTRIYTAALSDSQINQVYLNTQP